MTATTTAGRLPAADDERDTSRSHSLLDEIAEKQASIGARYMPALQIEQAIERKRVLDRFVRELMVEDEDYGTIPGTSKPTLYKPGAEKLCAFFGYVPIYTTVERIEDWSGADHGGEPLFYYHYSCLLEKDRQPVGQGEGSSNSWESKYRYRWAQRDNRPLDWDKLLSRDANVSEFGFAIEKGETSGQYGKPAEYWQAWRDAIADGKARQFVKKSRAGKDMDAWEMGGREYRVPNDGFPDIINTCQKMGQKRAYIAATLSATGASQYFTQDMEDIPEPPPAPSSGGQRKGAETPPAKPANNPAPAGASPSSAAPSRPIPDELMLPLSRLHEPGQAQIAFNWIRDEMILAGQKDGENAYARVTSKIRDEYPKGRPVPLSVYRDALIELWGELLHFRAKSEPPLADETESM